jgi:hypothetical protein
MMRGLKVSSRRAYAMPFKRAAERLAILHSYAPETLRQEGALLPLRGMHTSSLTGLNLKLPRRRGPELIMALVLQVPLTDRALGLSPGSMPNEMIRAG